MDVAPIRLPEMSISSSSDTSASASITELGDQLPEHLRIEQVAGAAFKAATERMGEKSSRDPKPEVARIEQDPD